MGRDTHHEERRLRGLWWMGGSVRRQLFVVHAKEGRTKTSVVVEINTSTYAAQTSLSLLQLMALYKFYY
jgi:hypothetical protein